MIENHMITEEMMEKIMELPNGHTGWPSNEHPAMATKAVESQRKCQTCGKKTSYFCLQCSYGFHIYVPICSTTKGDDHSYLQTGSTCLGMHAREVKNAKAIIKQKRVEAGKKERNFPLKSKYV